MNSSLPFVSVIIPAAGKSTRMKEGIDKLLIPLDGAPLLSYPLYVFEQSPVVTEVIVAVSPDKKGLVQEEIVRRYGFHKVKKIVSGGARRQDSVGNGLKAVSPDAEIVLVHDGARPFVTLEMIEACALAAMRFGACVVGVPAKATLKECDGDQFVTRTPPRDRMWEIQTPQGFQVSILAEAYEKAEAQGLDVTDDASLVEALGKPVKVVQGSYENIKVTTPEDLLLAELILKKQKEHGHAGRTRV